MSKLIIIAGAPKAYTSSIVFSLSNGKGPPFVKEQHFLLMNLQTLFLKNRATEDFETYLKKAYVSEGLYIDASMTYFTEELCGEKIKLVTNFFEQIEVYCFLRNPVERILSCYNMDLSNGWVSNDLSFYLSRELGGEKNAYGAGPRYIAESLYFQNISRLKGLFPDLSVVTVEELSAGWWFSGQPSSVLAKKNSFSNRAAPRWVAMVKEQPVVRRILMNIGSPLKKIIKLLLYRRIARVVTKVDSRTLSALREDMAQLETLLTPSQRIIVREWFSHCEQ